METVGERTGCARGHTVAEESYDVAQHRDADHNIACSTHACVDGAVECEFNEAEQAVQNEQLGCTETHKLGRIHDAPHTVPHVGGRKEPAWATSQWHTQCSAAAQGSWDSATFPGLHRSAARSSV